MPDVAPVPSALPDRTAVARRTILRCAAAVGGVAVTGACGGGSETPAPASGRADLGPTADVPVGGGKIYAEQQVVVTQPTEGEFKAFSSICTHAGCPVASVTETINCDCHGSRYSLEDGSVVGGPAPRPLPAKSVTVEGADLVVE